MDQVILDFIGKATPTLIYLSGVVILFLRLEKAQKENATALIGLIERYHEQMREQTHTLTLLNEQLDHK